MQGDLTERAILVIGAGAMGRGIAAVVCVEANLNVAIVDVSQSAIDHCVRSIVAGAIRKGRNENEVRQRIATFSTIADAVQGRAYDLAIETATENVVIKKQLLDELAKVTPNSTVLATNTSSLSVTELAEILPSSERSRFIGMHFFNPADKVKGMEIIPSRFTSKEIIERTLNMCKSFGKAPVLCRMDISGFIVNRIINANFLEALHLVEIGAGSPKEIDTLMRNSAGYAMGPFQVADLVGLDVSSFVQKNIYEGSGKDSKYLPSPILDSYVKENKLGRKSGEGFYKYSKL